MIKKLLAFFICLFALNSVAAAEIQIASTSEENGRDSIVRFSAEALNASEEEKTIAEMISGLIRAKLQTDDAEAVYARAQTVTGTQEAVITQQAFCWQDGKIASLAVLSNGEQKNRRRISQYLTAAINLETGSLLSLSDLFSDEAEAVSRMEALIEEEILGTLSDYYEFSELLPLPTDAFYFDSTGLTICYPQDRYRFFNGECGAVHFSWVQLQGLVGEVSPIAGLASLPEGDAEAVNRAIAEGAFPGLPLLKLDAPMEEVLAQATLLADPDYTRLSYVYLFQDPCLRHYAAETLRYDSAQTARISAVRASNISLYGITTGISTKDAVISLMGEPAEIRSYGENEAQDEMIAPGDSFFYSRDDHVLEIHFDSDGVCCMLILRTDIPQKLY